MADKKFVVVEFNDKAERMLRIIDDPVDVYIAMSKWLTVRVVINPNLCDQTIDGVPLSEVYEDIRKTMRGERSDLRDAR